MNIILIVAITFAVGAIGYMTYASISEQRKLLKYGRIVRILLYQQIGTEKVFIGSEKGIEMSEPNLGVFIWIKGAKSAISGVRTADFFLDQKNRKCLEVVKFAEDDFRAVSRIRDGEWYRKVRVPDEERFKTEEVEEDGETFLRYCRDEKGNRIPIIGEDGKRVPEYALEPYFEPKAITQQAREAQRFNRSHALFMQSKRAEKKKWWEMLAPYLAVSVVALFMLMGFAYMTKTNSETQVRISENLGAVVDGQKEVLGEMKNPGFLSGIIDNYMKEKNEEDSPPK